MTSEAGENEAKGKGSNAAPIPGCSAATGDHDHSLASANVGRARRAEAGRSTGFGVRAAQIE